MKSLINYVKESLLDDFDILDKSSETAAKKSQSIGNDYKVNGVYMNGDSRYFCNTFDKRKIKNACKTLYWGDQDIDVYKVSMFNPIENKSVIEMIGYICNIILSGDKEKIYDKDYIKTLFKDVVKDDVWYKHLILMIDVEKSYNTIVIYIRSDLAIRSPYIKIHLKKK